MTFYLEKKKKRGSCFREWMTHAAVGDAVSCRLLTDGYCPGKGAAAERVVRRQLRASCGGDVSRHTAM